MLARRCGGGDAGCCTTRRNDVDHWPAGLHSILYYIGLWASRVPFGSPLFSGLVLDLMFWLLVLSSGLGLWSLLPVWGPGSFVHGLCLGVLALLAPLLWLGLWAWPLGLVAWPLVLVFWALVPLVSFGVLGLLASGLGLGLSWVLWAPGFPAPFCVLALLVPGLGLGSALGSLWSPRALLGSWPLCLGLALGLSWVLVAL